MKTETAALIKILCRYLINGGDGRFLDQEGTELILLHIIALLHYSTTEGAVLILGTTVAIAATLLLSIAVMYTSANIQASVLILMQ